MARRIKSSITSNVDSKLTPRERAEKEVDDRNEGRIQDAVEKQSGKLPAPKLIHAGQQYTTTYDKLASQSDTNAPSLVPIAIEMGAHYPGGFRWILSDGDMDLVEAGLYCFRCLDRYPELWAPVCTTCGTERELLNRL
jgi:hypothetical protein